MSSGATPMWYLLGPGNQPVGPYSADQIVQSVRRGQVAASVPVWREGTPKWLPLGQVEPFASALRPGAPVAGVQPVQTPAPGRGILGRLVWILFWLVFVGVLGAVGYFGVSEWLTVQKAKGLIAAKDFSGAVGVLKPFHEKTYLFPKEAPYLLGMAMLKEYAAAKEEQQAAAEALDKPQRLLKDAIAAGEVWRNRGTLDLDKLLDLVPAGAPDALSRALVLAKSLQDLELADAKQTASQLAAKAKQVMKEGLGAKGRMPDGRLLGQTVGKDPAMVSAFLAAILADPSGPAPAGDPMLAHIRRWSAEEPPLAGPMSAGLLQAAEKHADAGKREYASELLRAAMSMEKDSQKRDEVVRKHVALARKQLEAGEPQGLLEALDRALSGWPRTAEAGDLYLDAAKRLQQTDAAGARRAMDEALRLNAKLAETEEAALLWLALNPQPSDERLRRAIELTTADNAKKSASRPQVLMVVVSDVAKLGARGISQNQGYLAAARAAADELLSQSPDAKNLDQEVLALAKALYEGNRADEAIRLAEALQKAVPKSPLRLEIAEKIETWRRQKGKTGDPQDDQLLALVERELKVARLSSPGVIRAIVDDPAAHQVIEVADGCTADQFRSEEAAMLRRWVAQGGILWANSNVLTLFDVKYGGIGPISSATCVPAMSAQACPILKDCEKVTIHVRGGYAFDLSHTKVYPLLKSGDHTYWSLIAYEKGWISDVKPVETTLYDGAKFWLNFRLFCIGKVVVPTGRAGDGPPPLARDEVTVIATVPELEKALAEPEKLRVLWIRLNRATVGAEQVEQLRKWVGEGGVLWLETDLAGAFGFKLKANPSGQVEGVVFASDARHPVLEGLSPNTPVKVAVAPGALFLQMTLDDLSREGIIPLLGEVVAQPKTARPPKTPKQVRVNVLCGVRSEGQGFVVFRPRTIDQTEKSGKQFEENLRRWSLQVARPAAPPAGAVPPGAKPAPPATTPPAATPPAAAPEPKPEGPSLTPTTVPGKP